jgi:hypothetical protein
MWHQFMNERKVLSVMHVMLILLLKVIQENLQHQFMRERSLFNATFVITSLEEWNTWIST